MRKKGVLFSVMLLVITLIALTTLAVILMNQQAQIERAVGERQFELISATERGEMALNYLDLAVSFLANDAIQNISKTGGFSGETDCGEYRDVNMWNCQENETYGSFPMHSDVESSFIDFVEPELDSYLRNYEREVFPPGNYIFSVSKKGVIRGETLNPMIIHNKSFEVSFQAEPESDKNRIVWHWPPGQGGERFSGLAENFASRYSDLPYVRGGVTPYPYHVATKEKEQGNAVLEGAYIPRTQPGFDCSGFVWWTLRHMSIDVDRKTAHGFYHWAQETGEVVCDSNKNNDCWSSLEEIKEHAEPGDLFFIDPCLDNTERDVCHIAIYAGDGKIVDSSGPSDGVAVRELPPGYLPGNRWETVAIYRPNFSGLDTFDMENGDEQDVEEERIQEIEPEEQDSDFLYDDSQRESGFRYLVKPSFSIDTNYNFSVYGELRRQSLGFIENVQDCEDTKSVEDCVDELIVDVGGRDFDWFRNCTDKETLFRYRFEDVLRGCFESDCENCYCNLTLPENDLFEDFEYEFFISGNLTAEEMVLPFGEDGSENEEIETTGERKLLLAYFDEDGELVFDESEGYPFVADYDGSGQGYLELIDTEDSGSSFWNLLSGLLGRFFSGSDDELIKNIYFIKKDGKTALIGEEDLNELIAKKEDEAEEES
ncbi:MAG: C40 family peptidase, partial [Nanoarchaeota archaeon]